MRETTLPLSHFEAIYARGEDPWHFASSSYERDKYFATLAALPRSHYDRAFEIGCSIGVFTAMLAERCDNLFAIEPVASALETARRTNAERRNVRFAPMFVPREWPPELFELVIISEVLDYLCRADVEQVATHLIRSLPSGGDLVLVHWVGKKRAATAGASESSEILIAALAEAFQITRQHRNSDYRLDVLTRI